MATRGEVCLALGGMTVTLVVGWLGAAATAHSWPFRSDAPVSITIDKPSPSHQVNFKDDYGGTVKNLHRGEMVWMFDRQDRTGATTMRPRMPPASLPPPGRAGSAVTGGPAPE